MLCFLQAQLQQQEAEKSRQQELLYSIDFQCQAMQRKVSRISGYKTAAEAKALQKHMKELHAVCINLLPLKSPRRFTPYMTAPQLMSMLLLALWLCVSDNQESTLQKEEQSMLSSQVKHLDGELR